METWNWEHSYLSLIWWCSWAFPFVLLHIQRAFLIGAYCWINSDSPISLVINTILIYSLSNLKLYCVQSLYLIFPYRYQDKIALIYPIFISLSTLPPIYLSIRHLLGHTSLTASLDNSHNVISWLLVVNFPLFALYYNECLWEAFYKNNRGTYMKT